MTDYSRQEAAERAGVSLGEFSLLIGLGILTPAEGGRFTSGDIRKAELIQSLTAAGMPLEDLAAAISRGDLALDFVDQPAYERFTALSDLTFAQVSAETGVPVELLMVIREAEGGAPATPDDRVREGELEIAPFVELQVKMGFHDTAIERLLRAFGDTMRRAAETESHWWRTEVMEPQLAAGKRASEIGVTENDALMAKLSEEALISIFRAHQTHTWTANIIEGFETVLTQSGTLPRLDRPPAMCFLDITGYTRLTQERGDKAAADLAEQLGLVVNRSTVQHGGKPVKWLGDGVMCYFRDPGPGVLAALDMASGVTDAGLPPAHVGLHAGPVVFQGGDYFGQTVNIASRIAEYARPGEVLVSQAVVEAAAAAPIAFTDIGEVELKGVGGAMRLHSARHTTGAP